MIFHLKIFIMLISEIWFVMFDLLCLDECNNYLVVVEREVLQQEYKYVLCIQQLGLLSAAMFSVNIKQSY